MLDMQNNLKLKQTIKSSKKKKITEKTKKSKSQFSHQPV